MKPFNKMSQQEIEALSKEEFLSIDPEIRRSCYDCDYLIGYINLWCTSKEAIDYRGTSIPGCIKCIYWKLHEKKSFGFLIRKLFGE